MFSSDLKRTRETLRERAESSASFVLERPGHQVGQGPARVLVPVQDLIDLLDDRHLDAFAPGQRAGPRRVVGMPSATMRISADDVGQAAAAPQLQADMPVPAERTGAGQDAGRPCPASPEKVSRRAPSLSPSRAISARPRVMSGGPGVVAEIQGIRDAGGDGDDVLERAGQLHADDVPARCRSAGPGSRAGPGPGGPRRASAEARTSAVGWPSATSRAKLGPERTPIRPAPDGRRISAMISLIRMRVRLLDALGQADDVRAVREQRTPAGRRSPAELPEGTATKTMSAPSNGLLEVVMDGDRTREREPGQEDAVLARRGRPPRRYRVRGSRAGPDTPFRPR